MNTKLMETARFWSHVDVAAPDQCWEWTGSRNHRGGDYGRFYYQGRNWLAHRVAYLWNTGDLPDADLVHTCENPPCVNPDHLRPANA